MQVTMTQSDKDQTYCHDCDQWNDGQPREVRYVEINWQGDEEDIPYIDFSELADYSHSQWEFDCCTDSSDECYHRVYEEDDLFECGHCGALYPEDLEHKALECCR